MRAISSYLGFLKKRRNEVSSKYFDKKFDRFTNNTFDVGIKWLMQKVKNLFRVKDKSLHQACKILKVSVYVAKVI